MKDKIIKMLLIFLLGSVAINLSLAGMDEAVKSQQIEEKPIFSCLPGKVTAPPSSHLFSDLKGTNSSLLGYLFQLMFILFFISPPLIVLMLFLIWKELKERNKMK